MGVKGVDVAGWPSQVNQLLETGRLYRRSNVGQHRGLAMLSKHKVDVCHVEKCSSS